MDFRKIEIIFLLAFFGVNLFLFRIYQESLDERTTAAVNNTPTEAIERRLEDSHIKTKAALSDKKETGYYLSGKEGLLSYKNHFVDGNGTTLVRGSISLADFDKSPGEDSVSDEIDEKDLSGSVQKVISRLTFLQKTNEYHFDKNFTSLSADENEIVCFQAWEDILVADNTAQLTLTLKAGNSRKVTGFSQSYTENLEPLREGQELISEKSAVTTLYNNSRIPDKSTIKWTELAYSRIFKVRGKNVYVPVWFVAIDTGKGTIQIEQVNAITNAVMSNNSILEVKN